ncbi:FAD-dependent oxidoreductase [Faunimonas sp. B44]|uniref:FAD-dependent oxidoreductase n=1 Tax=Faunimonas sp. B44 TaxID=3461493 RepID=UPI004044EA5A
MRAAALRHIVLVGGGHAHVEVVRRFGNRRFPGVLMTLVSREGETPYSGMLPGLVAGHYRRGDIHVPLRPLCDAASAAFVAGEAVGLDLAGKAVRLKDGREIGYDLLSLDVGITPRLDGIEGAEAHAIAVKPIGQFLQKWEALEASALAPGGPRRIAVVGGGAAGFELVLAIRHRLRADAAAHGLDPDAFSFVLVTDGRLLAGQNGAVRRAAHRGLIGAKVALVEGARVTAIGAHAVHAGGLAVDADIALVATEAAAPRWLQESGLVLDGDGFVAVARTLRSLGDPSVFAAGDCATMVDDPRPKAGVFAVRQGPPLARNLRRAAEGRPLAEYRPQRQHLSILSTGDCRAIAARGPFKAEGGWVWRWKDRIDRRWIARYAAEAAEDFRGRGSCRRGSSGGRDRG